jgi:hypothetical protein
MVVMAALQLHGRVDSKADGAVHVSKYVGLIQNAVVPNFSLFEDFDSFTFYRLLGIIRCSHALLFPWLKAFATI